MDILSNDDGSLMATGIMGFSIIQYTVALNSGCDNNIIYPIGRAKSLSILA